MSDPIAAAEAAGKARDIANRFETAVFLIAYGIAEKDGLYEADPHRYPYSQAFRHGMNILAALCAECSDDAEKLLPTFNESDFIRNSAASDVREWTARWRDECREAVEGCRSIEIGPLASVDGDYFAATSECYEVLRFAENDLLGGHAVFTSLIFSVRPMGTPHDLGGRYRKLNGLIEREVGDYPANPGEFATEVRASAWRTWKTMERDENLPMGSWRTMGRQFLVDDAISTLMVTIIQIFGRLARLADKERPAPHVYFADAAFRGGDGKLSFRTLEELGAYMERLMHDSDQPEVAKALYGPFYESFRKGIGNVGL